MVTRKMVKSTVVKTANLKPDKLHIFLKPYLAFMLVFRGNQPLEYSFFFLRGKIRTDSLESIPVRLYRKSNLSSFFLYFISEFNLMIALEKRLSIIGPVIVLIQRIQLQTLPKMYQQAF